MQGCYFFALNISIHFPQSFSPCAGVPERTVHREVRACAFDVEKKQLFVGLEDGPLKSEEQADLVACSLQLYVGRVGVVFGRTLNTFGLFVELSFFVLFSSQTLFERKCWNFRMYRGRERWTAITVACHRHTNARVWHYANRGIFWIRNVVFA